jgi:protein ImuB
VPRVPQKSSTQPGEPAPLDAGPFDPHPNPLPAREREPDNNVRRARGRPTTAAPRKRRWNHQLWYDGPRDIPFPPVSADAPANARASLAATPTTTRSPAAAPNGPRLIAANVPTARDAATRAASNAAVDTCSRDIVQFGRTKLFMPDRGICQTPGIRANGPSYMKPVPPPVTRPPDASDDAAGADQPLVIIRTVAGRQLVTAASLAAARFGVRAGLTLTESTALCSRLKHFDEDPQKDARALEALARWMFRFTPRVALPLPGYDESGPEGACIYLDVTGCDRAFGGISNLVAQVVAALSRLRLSAGVAVAPTPGAAWALASFTPNAPIVPHHELSSALAPLPVMGLRLDEDLLAALHHLGIETIDQVTRLPRSALPSRFGDQLLLRLDQALGRIDEPLVPLAYHAPVEARMDFDGAVSSLEAIHLVFQRLIGEVIADLTRRGCGARRLEVEFFRAYAQTVRHTIALSRPSRDAKNLFNLIRCATEDLEQSNGRRRGRGRGDDGFLGIRLAVSLFERVTDEQIALLDGERYAGEIELAGLIERLTVRMGDNAIAQPVLVESHVPEKAFAWHGFLTRVDDGRRDLSQTRVENPCHRGAHRPLQLLLAPIEIAVMVSPSEDRDGRPILFRLDREVHHLTHAVGPERISGQWWRGHDKTRDYFDVEDNTGRRFWLFRVHETNKWYVHGIF